MARPPAVAAQHMLENIERLERHAAGRTIEQYKTEALLEDAMERCVERISEAARSIPENIRKQYDTIMWRDIITIGNNIRHRYDNVRPDVIWEIATNHGPAIKVALAEIIELTKGYEIERAALVERQKLPPLTEQEIDAKLACAGAASREEVLRDHAADQRRAAKGIAAPTDEFSKVLPMAREQMRAELEHNEELRKEAAAMARDFSGRFSEADVAAARQKDFPALSKSLAVDLAQAERIATIRQQVFAADKICREISQSTSTMRDSARQFQPPPLIKVQPLPDLTPEVIAAAVHADRHVDSSRSAVGDLSQTVYGNRDAHAATLARIETAPAAEARALGDAAGNAVRQTPDQAGPLVGELSKWRSVPDAQRTAAMAAVPALAAAIQTYGQARGSAQDALIRERRDLQKRLAKEVLEPSKALQEALTAPVEKQIELFKASKPLRDELTALNIAFAARLAPADNAAIAKGDMPTLAKSFDVDVTQAARIATVRTQANAAANVVRNKIQAQGRTILP